jgi:phage terminase small subunit
MPRGRRAQPDAVKALKGNPGKRKLLLEKGADSAAPAPAKLPPLQIPEFLEHEREIAIFRKVVEDYLQRRIARPADLTQYARWASYLHQWVTCKEQITKNKGRTYYLVESNHGKRLARLPSFKDMLDLERVLQSLEDRLGLNPAARQNIIKGLQAMPAALGGLFGEEKPNEEGDGDKPEPDEVPTAEQVMSPLGFLQAAASKPH